MYFYIEVIIITLWGGAHIVITKKVVVDFELKSIDDRRVLTMEWIAEGFTLCFIGILVVVVTVWGGSENPVSIIVYWASAVILIFMTVLSLFTVVRTPIIPYKICPPLFTTAATLFFLGSFL